MKTKYIFETDSITAVPEWYQGYVKALDGRDFLEVMKQHLLSTPKFFHNIPSEKHDFAYAPGKWTIKELLLHIIDGERIFAYRALCFARNDKTELPGFEENDYVPNSGAANRTMNSLIEEYKAVRNSIIHLFSNFTNEMLNRSGTANGYTFSVLLSGVIIVGHELHHLGIISERYLVD